MNTIFFFSCVIVGSELLLFPAEAFQFFQESIPNGDKVTNPCDNSEKVCGVGHINKAGGGPRNSFGLLFQSNGKKWTVDLCNADSDNDGLTNGQELGDPGCVWVPGATPSRTVDITHPAISNHC